MVYSNNPLALSTDSINCSAIYKLEAPTHKKKAALAIFYKNVHDKIKALSQLLSAFIFPYYINTYYCYINIQSLQLITI